MVFVTTEILLLLVSVFMLSQWEYNRHKHKDKEDKRVIIEQFSYDLEMKTREQNREDNERK